MTPREKAQRTKQILKNTPKYEGKLLLGINYFPIFIILENGERKVIYDPKEKDDADKEVISI